MLSSVEAEEELKLAAKLMPGPWERHSISAAQNAKLIACSPDQKNFLERYLEQIEYDDYDLLIQLCDAISLPGGACIMEKRLVDVALRHGLPEFTLRKWKAFLNTKTYFDELCGCNIYTFLPNVLENSFVNLI